MEPVIAASGVSGNYMAFSGWGGGINHWNTHMSPTRPAALTNIAATAKAATFL